MKQLHERVALAMRENGVRPVDIPRLGGPSRPTVHRILTDPAYKADGLTLDRLADALRVSRLWLRWGSGPMSSTVFLPTGGGKTDFSYLELLSEASKAESKGFGKRLAKAREEAGLTVKSAATKAKITQKHLTDLEEGKIQPDPLAALGIANALNVDLNWLFTGKRSSPAQSAVLRQPSENTGTTIDRDLLARAIETALSCGEILPTERVAGVVADAYELASKPGRADKIEELVRALIL